MSLRRLFASHFRNVISVDIELSPQINIIYGANGSGKTSLLEIINILSTGRSFRSRKHKNMINHQADAYTVFGRVLLESASNSGGVDIPVGISRDRSGSAQIKISGKQCASAAALAELLPVRVIDGHSFSLLEGAPLIRRQFMDWLVFHVEHEFYEVWKSFEKCLKHRNTLLRRDKIDPLQLSSWDRELTILSERLDKMRLSAFQALEPVFMGLIKDFEELQGLTLGYYRGWDRDTSVADLLLSTQARDIALGYTRQGPHRADLKVQINGSSALEILSRGQQKIVVSALLIAQGMVFSQTRQRRCLYLIDDLPAELDTRFRATLAEWLKVMGCQVCVTGVDRQVLLRAWFDDENQAASEHCKVFHVERGGVRLDSESNVESQPPETETE